MPDKIGWLPPAAEDIALAQQVNDRLPTHARVTPTRKDKGDDGFSYGLVFEYFDARKPVERDYPFFDADEVVKMVIEWINVELPRYREMDNWVIAH